MKTKRVELEIREESVWERLELEEQINYERKGKNGVLSSVAGVLR